MADVICPQCGGRYHETTDNYRVGVITTGNMITLKKQYRDNGWTSFPEHAGMAFGDLECPECGGQYSTNGIVRIDSEQYERELRLQSTATAYAECDNQSDQKRRPGRPRK